MFEMEQANSFPKPTQFQMCRICVGNSNSEDSSVHFVSTAVPPNKGVRGVGNSFL